MKIRIKKTQGNKTTTTSTDSIPHSNAKNSFFFGKLFQSKLQFFSFKSRSLIQDFDIMIETANGEVKEFRESVVTKREIIGRKKGTTMFLKYMGQTGSKCHQQILEQHIYSTLKSSTLIG